MTHFPELLESDAHDRELAARVHPADWRNPTPAGRYDLVVIGAGTAGLVTAAGAAGLGARVALVERGLMGGDCLNVGCVPSKALLRAARAAADARAAHAFGVRTGPVEVDFAAVMERLRALRARIAAHDSAERFRALGVDVHLGEARFTGRERLEVAGQVLRFARACIATGGRPVLPAIPGLASAQPLTNETFFRLTQAPRRLAVLGGGPIGCELAQAMARLGTSVVLVQRGPRLLPRDEPEASALVAAALARDGVEVLCAAQVESVRTSGDGRELALRTHAGPLTRTVDALLVAVGREPALEQLGLEAAGVESDPREGVRVDDFLRTTNPRIFAAGDVASRHKFTHMADALARIVVRNALFLGRARASALHVPWCTYTDPEVAHVGSTLAEERARGRAIDVHDVPLARVDRAVLDGEEEGFLRVHTARGGKPILGATLVARHAGETISQVTLAMVAGAGLDALAATLHPYPTQAEVLKRAADQAQRARLTPRAALLLARFLRLRRSAWNLRA